MRIFLVLCLISFLGCEAEKYGCEDYFTGDVFTNYDPVLVSNIDASESTAIGTELITIGYNSTILDAPQPATGTGVEYLDGVDTGDSIVVSVIKTMEGLIDFPESTDNLLMIYKFPLEEDNSKICELQIRVDLQDENTQTPTTDEDSYTYTVREDYPEMLTVPNFQIVATDLDYTSPNNQFTVTFKESECPLESDEPTYTPIEGGNVSVTFHLKNKVDYDSMGASHDITCSGSATDGGSAPLEKKFSLILTVDPFSDEPPRFEYPLYSTELDSLEATGSPLPISPAAIKATDNDNDVIVYSMEASDESAQWKDYFTIDSSTAEVTQVKDLELDMVELIDIFYIVKASDGTSTTDSSSDTTVLQINLSGIEIPTTTQSTTTEGIDTTTQCETCEPCPTEITSFITTTLETCPPCETTVSSVTESCPPCSTISPIFTTTQESCPPCTTDSTTCPICSTESTTCPTCSTESTTCPSCQTESTCPSCPTESFTCPACPTESMTCPTYATEGSECPTCTTEFTCPPCTTESISCTTNSPESSDCPTCTTDFTCPPCSTESITCPTLESSTDSNDKTDSPTSCPTCEPCTTFSPPSSDNPLTEESPSSSSSIPDNPTHSTEMSTCPTCAPCECTTIKTESSTSSLPDVTTHTDTGSSSPDPSVPTTPSTSTPIYMFERSAYHYQVYTTTLVVDTLKVISEEESNNPENVLYRWETVTEENKFILLDDSTGQISLDTDNAKAASYDLVAIATVDKQEITTKVNILVQSPPTCDDITLSFGILEHTIKEDSVVGEQLVNIIDDEGRAKGFCIQGTKPDNYEDYFSIDANGVLTLIKQIDADQLEGDDIKIRVHASETEIMEGECPVGQDGSLRRNEAYVIIYVEDVNDEVPVIVKPSESSSKYGYPIDNSLQQVVGPVLTVQMSDKDSTGELSVSLTGADATHFLEETESDTSSIYLIEPEACTEVCDITLKASDGEQSSTEKKIQVTSLSMDSIFTVEFTSLTTTEIENKIQEISNNQKDKEINILYMTVLDGTASRQTRRRKARALPKADGAEWTTKAHVYGFNSDGSLLNIDEMNEVLSSESLETETFSEKEVFNPPAEDPTDVSGYQAAIGVLGALVGLVLIAVVAGFVLHRKKYFHVTKNPKRKQSTLQGVSTLGAEYPNHGYDDNEMKRIRGDSISTASSGYSQGNTKQLPTVIPVIDSQERESYQRQQNEDQYRPSRSSDSDQVASFTAFRGKEEETRKSAQNYSPVYKKKSAQPSIYSDNKLSTDGEIEKSSIKNASSRDKVTAFPGVQVRQKKEPPSTSTTAVKPIMKNKSEGNNSPSTPKSSMASPSASFKKTNSANSDASSESERKKSVDFKVLVDVKNYKDPEEDETTSI